MFNCVVLSSVVCETGFSVLKQIRTTRNKLLRGDARRAYDRLLMQILPHLFMSLDELVEHACDVWDDGTRCAVRSHPGIAHKCRSMLDAYDDLEWEKQDNIGSDAEVIGSFDNEALMTRMTRTVRTGRTAL